MAMFAPIPLPSTDNPQFKDIMDYLETIQARKQQKPLTEAQARNLNAEAVRNEKLAELPFAGRQLPGAAGEALGLEMLRAQYGEDSPQYQQAKQIFNLERQRALQTMAYQQSLMDTQGKRFASPEGKRAQESAEIESGVMPGTSVGNRPGIPLTPKQKKILQGQYSLKAIKDATDVGVRQRVGFARNMDITMENLDPKALTSYSGIKGGTELIRDRANSLRGKTSQRYKDYEDALTNAKLLAKQVRQFYGDSITPSVQEGLKELTNPTSWLKNPDVALSKFNKFRNTLKSEENTFLRLVNEAGLYAEPEAEQEPEEKEPKRTPAGKIILYENGEERHIPPELMQEALAAGLTLEP